MKEEGIQLFSTQSVRGGRRLYCYGDAVNPVNPSCFKVTSGIVLLIVPSEERNVVSLVEAGGYFGEEEYLALGRRRYGAIALCGAEVERVPVSPAAMTALLSDIAERLYFQHQLLALKGATEKIRFILERYPGLHLGNGIVAEILGVSRRSVEERRREVETPGRK